MLPATVLFEPSLSVKLMVPPGHTEVLAGIFDSATCAGMSSCIGND